MRAEAWPAVPAVLASVASRQESGRRTGAGTSEQLDVVAAGPGRRAARRVTVGDRTFEARRAVVPATGGRPRIPPVPGTVGTPYRASRDAMAARELPGSAIVPGGGAIGVELAQVLARFGCRHQARLAVRDLPGEPGPGADYRALRIRTSPVRLSSSTRRWNRP